MNILEYLLEKYPDEEWSYDFGLSQNEHFKLSLIDKYPDKPWSWPNILRNGIVSIKAVIKSELKSETLFIPKLLKKNNKNLTKDHMDLNVEEHKFWYFFSMNPNLTLRDIEKYGDNFPNFWYISANKNVRPSYIFKNLHRDWSWIHFSENPNITLKAIKKLKDKISVNLISISKNIKLTIDMFEENYHLPWNPWGLSVNLTITWEFVVRFPDISWNWCALSRNPNITMDIIEANPDRPWNWKSISSNPNITIEYVKKYMTNLMKFDWSELSKNEGIKMEDIESHKKFPWRWQLISMNPNITLEFIDKYQFDLDFYVLSFNKFSLYKKGTLDRVDKRKHRNENNTEDFNTKRMMYDV